MSTCDKKYFCPNCGKSEGTKIVAESNKDNVYDIYCYDCGLLFHVKRDKREKDNTDFVDINVDEEVYRKLKKIGNGDPVAGLSTILGIVDDKSEKEDEYYHGMSIEDFLKSYNIIDGVDTVVYIKLFEKDGDTAENIVTAPFQVSTYEALENKWRDFCDHRNLNYDCIIEFSIDFTPDEYEDIAKTNMKISSLLSEVIVSSGEINYSSFESYKTAILSSIVASGASVKCPAFVTDGMGRKYIIIEHSID